MSAPFAPRSSASRLPWWKSAPPSAAPASMSAASPRRRCCMPPNCSRKPGIKGGTPELDLGAKMKFKQEGVDGNVKGVDFLLKKNKVDAYMGAGRILGAGKVEVKGADGKTQTLETKNIVIATGSDVAKLKGIEIDEKRVISSDTAISLDKV